MGSSLAVHRLNRARRPRRSYPLPRIHARVATNPAGVAYAVRELVKPAKVIPIHDGTLPPLKGTPARFKAALGTTSIKILDVEPGQAVTF